MSGANWTEKREDRNHAGVKNSSDTYRTFGGAHYSHFEIDPTAEYVANLRAAGIRCRRVGVELYVHHEDCDRAVSIPGHH